MRNSFSEQVLTYLRTSLYPYGTASPSALEPLSNHAVHSIDLVSLMLPFFTVAPNLKFGIYSKNVAVFSLRMSVYLKDMKVPGLRPGEY